jgi:Superfamily II DNA/RNA helicases, SNF2 family
MRELWEHQRKAVEFANARDWAGYFMEAGTGKSGAAITALRYRYNTAKRIQRTLIIAPLSVCPQWKEEFALFSKIPMEQILVLTGDGKKRLKQLETSNAPIVITNYEFVRIAAFYEAVKKWAPEILVLDEIHRTKDATSDRTKKLIPIADQAGFKLGLTGTPVLNGEADLFGQIRLLDGGKHFGTSYYTFRKIYMYDKNAGMPKARYFPDWRVKETAKAYFAEVLGKNCFQVKKSECLDLPPLHEIVIPIAMTPKQEELYTQMKRHLVVELEGNTSVAEFAMTKALRLQQILCGFVQDSDTHEVSWVDGDSRIQALGDLLESFGGEKVIVWTVFQPTYDRIVKLCSKMGLEYALLTGEQSTTQKQDAIESFQKGIAQVLISNPAAGGVGINLQAAKYSIYFARSWSLEHLLQSQARNYRAGSEIHDKVTHYHLVAKNTLDEDILNALLTKQQIGEVLLNWAKQHDKESL